MTGRRRGVPTKPETVAAGTEFSDLGPDPFAARPEAEDVEPDDDTEALAIVEELAVAMSKRADAELERVARHPRFHERYAGTKVAEAWREAASMVRGLVEGDEPSAE